MLQSANFRCCMIITHCLNHVNHANKSGYWYRMGIIDESPGVLLHYSSASRGVRSEGVLP